VTAVGIVHQEVEPGVGARSHTHTFDEVITIVVGRAEVWSGDERAEAGPGTTVFIPAGVVHGFRNAGASDLHLTATITATELSATFIDD
jgi:mannose-6-phosphate isomerase-like protein (cupin superfamily)